MASKLLARLRRTLFKEGAAPAGTGPGAGPGAGLGEDCPESAELEDDTECVSARLSGTLRFEGEGGGRVLDDQDAGDTSGPDSDSDFLTESVENGSCSTDGSPATPPEGSWSGSQCHAGRDMLLFEVTDATVVQEGASKYVLYTIHVIQSGMFDKTPALITRRYTDFERLHARLRRRHGDETEGVCFPRKKLRRNFVAETIAKRSRGFEQYLAHLHSLAELRHAPTFLEFFYLGDLRGGQVLLLGGRHQEALGLFLNALRLQEKLGCQKQHQQQAHWLFTLTALVVCFQDLEQLGEAQENCDRALELLAPSRDDLQRQLFHPLLIPLLQTNVRLSWKISKDKRKWEALLLEIQDAGVDTGSQPGLEEQLVKEVLEDSERGPQAQGQR